ncbi:hypothetical protein ABS71_20265 [bacterium SCN 62-11]|nr:MAG: hypothetical protein ABS71_20265 [bacterium SCN 62-11]
MQNLSQMQEELLKSVVEMLRFDPNNYKDENGNDLPPSAWKEGEKGNVLGMKISTDKNGNQKIKLKFGSRKPIIKLAHKLLKARQPGIGLQAYYDEIEQLVANG